MGLSISGKTLSIADMSRTCAAIEAGEVGPINALLPAMGEPT